MANTDYLTTTSELTSVADAIRTKGGTSSPLTYPTGFVTAIGNIPTGTDVSDTTAIASDVAQGKYFYTSSGVRTEGTASGGGTQPQLNAPSLSVSGGTDGKAVIHITNPASNGNFVTKYKVYVDSTYSHDVTTTTFSIATAGSHSVAVKACGTDFNDSALSTAVTIVNYTISVTTVDCSAISGNPTILSTNGTTATLYFNPTGDLVIRNAGVAISGASLISTNKETGAVTIGSATGNITMTVTALVDLGAAILKVTGLGNSDPTTVSFTTEGETFNWNFDEVTVNGNIFIKIPTVYRKILATSNNQITSCALSDVEADSGYKPYPCFVNGSSVLPYVLIGKYCSSSTTTMNSVNATQATQTLENGRTNARALGTGYQLYDWQFQKLFVDLALCHKQNVNFNSGTTINEYLGVAHLANSIWVDGIYHNNTTWYASDDPSKYVSNPSSHPPTGYYSLSYSCPTSNYEVQTLGYDTNHPFVNYPSSVINNTSYNTYYCDRHYYSTGSHPVYSYVGYANALNGLWYCGASGSWAYTVGVRLCYKPLTA